MPLWLERFLIERPVVVWLPLVVCVVGAGVLWWWQSGRAKSKEGGQGGENWGGRVVSVGWTGALAVLIVLLGGMAWGGHVIGLWVDVWEFVCERPTLLAWWVAGVAVTVMVWGVAVHAWRRESRLARQCRGCGYDMTGVAGLMTCPECGRVARNEKQLRPVNVRRPALWAGVVLLLLAWSTPTWVAVARRGWAAGLPNAVLLWWVGKTLDAPDPVFLEAGFRASDRNDHGKSEMTVWNADSLAERLLEADNTREVVYSNILAGCDVSKAMLDRAVAQVGSIDPQKRVNAMALLIAAQNKEMIDAATMLKWAQDPAPAVRQRAEMLIALQRTLLVNELVGAMRAKALPPPERLRQMLRLCVTSSGFSEWNIPSIEPLSEHADPEVAAMAGLLVGGNFVWRGQASREQLIRFMRAQEYLERQTTMKPEYWWRLSWWFSSTVIDRTKYLDLIDDSDPAVRALFFRSLTPAAPIARAMRVYAPDSNVESEALQRFEMRLSVERDPEARAALVKLVESIKASQAGPLAQPGTGTP